MSVNIFGSGIYNNGGPGQKGAPGVGFKLLDDEGNYNIASKRLANVGSAVDDGDAINKLLASKMAEDLRGAMLDMKDMLKADVTAVNTRLIRVEGSAMDELREYVDGLIGGVRLWLDGLSDRLSNEMTSVRENVDGIDKRLSTFNKAFDDLAAVVSDVSSDSAVFVQEVEFAKRLLQTKTDAIKNRMEGLEESVTSFTVATGERLSLLDGKISALDNRVNALVKANIERSLQ
jgi:hypothetical protein